MMACFSCQKESITESRSKTLIISSFPETGQSLSNLSIRKFNDNGSFTVPVNDADARIVWKNNSFSLQASSNMDGMYNMNLLNFEFQPGNSYRLEIDYKGEFVTGETTMPLDFQEFNIDKSVIDIYNDDGQLIDPIEMDWRQGNNLMYSVSITPFNSNPENAIDFPNLSADMVQSYRTELGTAFDENSFSIHPAHFTHYGDNTIEVIAIDERFADFFQINENGTTLSNIKNGKGYFIGVSKYSIVVKVE